VVDLRLQSIQCAINIASDWRRSALFRFLACLRLTSSCTDGCIEPMGLTQPCMLALQCCLTYLDAIANPPGRLSLTRVLMHVPLFAIKAID
jgi:hypothetical protein